MLRAGPGDGLLVGLAAGEAAVENADQAVRERAQRLWTRLAASAMGIVVRTTAWRGAERRVGPAVAGVSQVAVARHPREHGVAGA